jgi:phytoene synthase
MPEREQLEQSKTIQRRTGRNFHVATRLFPERIRHATYVLYGFFRIADDVVDDPEAPPAPEQRAELARIRAEALGEQPPTNPVLAAFDDLREQYDISEREIEEFVSAMERDVSPEDYDTYEDLEAYLRGSAVAVAYMMLDVVEPESPASARPHARALGEAFQLTNFLRDVREDVLDYDRVYLPVETLERHGVSTDQVRRLEFSEGFAAAMRTELERTEALYRTGVEGIEHLPADCQFPVLLAAVIYADHHRLVREQGYDVLSRRPTLSNRRRLTLLARTWWHWRRTGDPVETFAAMDPFGDEADAGVSVAGLRRASDPVKRAVTALRSRFRLSE